MEPLDQLVHLNGNDNRDNTNVDNTAASVYTFP